MSDQTEISLVKCEVHIEADTMGALMNALIQAISSVNEFVYSRLPSDVRQDIGGAKLDMVFKEPPQTK